MRRYERTKRALYWTAISLIECEGLLPEEVARHMGVERDELGDILSWRRTVRLDRRHDRHADAAHQGNELTPYLLEGGGVGYHLDGL